MCLLISLSGCPMVLASLNSTHTRNELQGKEEEQEVFPWQAEPEERHAAKMKKCSPSKPLKMKVSSRSFTASPTERQPLHSGRWKHLLQPPPSKSLMNSTSLYLKKTKTNKKIPPHPQNDNSFGKEWWINLHQPRFLSSLPSLSPSFIRKNITIFLRMGVYKFPF